MQEDRAQEQEGGKGIVIRLHYRSSRRRGFGEFSAPVPRSATVTPWPGPMPGPASGPLAEAGPTCIADHWHKCLWSVKAEHLWSGAMSRILLLRDFPGRPRMT